MLGYNYNSNSIGNRHRQRIAPTIIHLAIHDNASMPVVVTVVVAAVDDDDDDEPKVGSKSFASNQYFSEGMFPSILYHQQVAAATC